MGNIYKITNIKNNKIYIGQTTKSDIEKRLQEHIRESRMELRGTRKLTFLHFAILEWGSENFKIECLEECKNEELDEREQYYIEYFNTYMPNGYNMTVGGQDSNALKNIRISKPVYQYDLNGNYIQSFKDSEEAFKKTGVSAGGIRNVCLGRSKTSGGYHWFREYKGLML